MGRKTTLLRTPSSGFVILPVLVLIAIGVVLVAKITYDKRHVLGKSSLIAQVPPDGSGAGSGTGGSQPPPPQENQPQQQSQPAPQPESQPQQNQAPQPGSGGGAANPQPGSGQGGQGNAGAPAGNPVMPGSGSTQQGGQQQYQPRNAEEQRQYQQQGEQQRPQQYQGTGQAGSQGQSGQQGQPLQQPGLQGHPGEGGPANQQPYTPQFSQEQYKEFQKQFKQEAEKRGFQISGSLPSQFLDQLNSSNQGQGKTTNPQPGSGQEGQGNTGQTGSGNTSQPAQFNPSLFQALPSPDAFPTIRGNFTVSAATGRRNINLNDINTKIKLEVQGQNSPLTAVRPDGTQVPIDKAELGKINTAIKLVTGSEIEQNGDKFNLKRGQVEAETVLPISFNVATKSFTVQIAGGEQQVKVLPDEVAQKLIKDNVLNQLQTSTTSVRGGASTTQVKVSLTELDNKAVYEVQGASQQKFLGFVPVSITKTVYVSAETGNQVKTNESFASRLLDIISF